MSRFAAPIAEQIWDMKYRFKDADGTPRDMTVEDSWRRIARDLAQVEKNPEAWEQTFFEALEDFKFLPAGRITAGAGKKPRGLGANLFRSLGRFQVSARGSYHCRGGYGSSRDFVQLFCHGHGT